MEIGKKLKEARLNRDLTQEVIAEKLNVSQAFISQLCSGAIQLGK